MGGTMRSVGGTQNQPRTQALRCFYRDQWQLINAKCARVLGHRVLHTEDYLKRKTIEKYVRCFFDRPPYS